MSGTWATIPECLSLAFSLNVVPGNARTEANPLHVAFVSEHPTYEGFNSRAYANPNVKTLQIEDSFHSFNSRAYANLNEFGAKVGHFFGYNSRAYANLNANALANERFNFRAKYRRVEKVY